MTLIKFETSIKKYMEITKYNMGSLIRISNLFYIIFYIIFSNNECLLSFRICVVLRYTRILIMKIYYETNSVVTIETKHGIIKKAT